MTVMVWSRAACFTRHTTYGYEIYAIGANAEAARLSGIPVARAPQSAYTC